MQKLLLVGSGGHSKVVIDAADDYNIIGLLDINYNKDGNNKILDRDVIGGFDLLKSFKQKDIELFICIGDNYIRQTYYDLVKDMGYRVATIIHPTAIVSIYSTIHEGCFINAGAIINANCNILENTIINTGAIIDHDSLVGPHCHIGPGAKLAGKVTVNSFSFLGIGCCVIPGVTIQEDVKLGAGAVAITNLEKNGTYVGVPAKRIS